MKKISICLSLMLTLMLLAVPAFAAETVSPEEITIEMLVEANSSEKLLENYGSYYLYIEYEGEVASAIYADNELCYMRISDDSRVYANGQECEINDGAFSVHLYAGAEPDLEWTTGIILYDPSEEIIEVVEDGEKFIVKTRFFYSGSSEEAESDYCEMVYEVDAQRLCILGGSYTNYTSDGVPYANAVAYVEYDAERPAEAQELMERMNPQEDYRTVTVVLDPGTENETACSARACLGDFVTLHIGAEYSGLYKDAECTQPFTGGSDPNVDVTVYASKAE